MDGVILFWKLLPYLSLLYAGVYWILEAIFPSLRDPNFNRWEIDESGGAYVQVMGWRKVLTPPRIVAQGYMSDNAACVSAIVGGALFVTIAVFGIRHTAGFSALITDLFERFRH